MEDAPGGLAAVVQLFVPQPCFDEFFVRFNLLHVACLKIVLSKCLGYAIILGAVMVKVPQILKIMNAKSAKGINFLGVCLELTAILSTLVYSYANSFPFSTYGETLFLLIQTWLIANLVLLYSGQRSSAIIFSVVVTGLLAFLLSSAAPAQLLWLLQASNMPNILIARLVQAAENYRNGSTGQLSAITVGLLWAGSLARIFTSLQETGDNIVVLQYVVAWACNCLIAGQMIWYWNVKPSTKVKRQ